LKKVIWHITAFFTAFPVQSNELSYKESKPIAMRTDTYAGKLSLCYIKITSFFTHLKYSFMKRNILGLTAVVLALTLSAFVSHSPKQGNGYYWFPLDPASGTPKMVTTLVYLPADPYACSNWAPGGYCSGAFTSYSGTHAPYAAAGSELLVHFSMFH